MSSSSSTPSTLKKPMRELNSITNHLLLTKTLNALTNNSSLTTTTPISIKENIPNDPPANSQQKSLNFRLNSALKPVERDNVAALLQFYQQQMNNSPSNASLSVENSSQLSFPTKSQTKKSMTFLCRFQQRNRLIEVPSTSEFFNSTSGISHEHLKQLITQEFQLEKTPLIIQIWNEQYNEYIDVESFKKIPFEARLQVLIEKSFSSTTNSPLIRSKSPTTPISSNVYQTSTPSDQQQIDDEPSISKSINYDDAANTVSPMENPCQTPMYDLLPKPSDGIPIPRFPPHIAAFLNGNGDANQLNALVQALYQEIVKYELYPNADELRSIVTRLVERHPNSVTVIGSVELLVRKLYYKFCNERKKYPVELKRRQPNKRKRAVREDEINPFPLGTMNSSGKFHVPTNDLDRLMHLWTNPSLTNISTDVRVQQHQDQHQQEEEQHDGDGSHPHSPSASSASPSSSPDLHERVVEFATIRPINLSMGINNLISNE